MKPDLPDFHLILGLLMNLVRAPAFDQLHGLLKRRRLTRSKKEMEMVRHYNKFMEQIGAFVTADKNTFN